jgi:hypothetical protein
MLFGSMEGTIPDGTASPYVVTWRGSGHVRLEGPAVVGEQARGPQRVEVLVDPSRGDPDALLAVSWTATDALDPVRDVHVWLPGMERAGLTFWPRFEARLRSMNAGAGPETWRTLDWTRVNEYGRSVAHGGFLFDLAGVITPSSPSQGTMRGVAPEFQVELCNRLGMNLHFQFPHRTDALSPAEYRAFLRRQLLVLRDGAPGVNGGPPFAGLDPDLTVTIELSNEIWNTGFPVNAWMSQEAARKGISFARQVAGEIQQVFDLAGALFQGADAPRLRTYMGGFAADPGHVRRVLAELRPGTRVDALGPAAYLGPRQRDVDAWLAGSSQGVCPSCPDTDGLFANLEGAVEFLRPLLAQHRAIADAWVNPDGSHPALELYEGGLNLKSRARPWAAAADAVHADPRLFALLTERFVPMLVDTGVARINWYSFMTDQDSPTLDAYGVWNDMEQRLTRPVVRPYVHQGAPKAAAVYLGPPAAAACPLARAVTRGAPLNFPVLSVAAPVLGGVSHASVDLGPSGDTLCVVAVSPFRATQLLPNGQSVLLSLSQAEFLEPRPGPVARWDVRIPNDPALAGTTLTAQAFMRGGGPSVNLTNAVDLTPGR